MSAENPSLEDLARAAARKAIGDEAALFVDANGGYTAKQAVRLSRILASDGVKGLEGPVSSDDLAGLAEVRGIVDIDVAAGEYGYDLAYFERMCGAGAVDVLQIDVSRCAASPSGCRAAAVAASHGLNVSSHTAQLLHARTAGVVANSRP